MDPSIKANLEDINRLTRQLDCPIYLVGGTVRDHLIRKPCSDYDFTARRAPEIARSWAQNVQRTLVPLDETPGHETYRVVLHPNLYFDFTTLQGQTIKEDLLQRDFTINAMAISLPDFIEEKENLIDPFQGQVDLHQKVIRAVRKQAFEEDPLRLLRAFRFASTLEFNIEPQTLAQIKTYKTKLNKIAKERVSYELLLLLGAARSQIDLMDSTGLIETFIPGITRVKEQQGDQPNSTLWNDTLNTLAELERTLLQPDGFPEQHAQRVKDYIAKNDRSALLKWSALLLPLAVDPAFDLNDFLRKFRLSNSSIQFIYRTLKFSNIVLVEARSTSGGFREDATVYQFIHRSGNELISSLLLSLAVRLGNQKDIKYFIPLINRILDFYIERYLPARGHPALLDGDALKNKFMLKPSPLFKSILDKVEEARVLGTIQTRKEAEQLAKELITSQVELTE